MGFEMPSMPATPDKPKGKSPEEKSQMVIELGGSLHDAWRAPRKKEDGTYEPRVKPTKDEAWKTAHGTDQVDIANTPFAELPSDWQGENKLAAEAAMKLVIDAAENGRAFDDMFVDEASAAVHDAWMARRKAEGYDENDPNWSWAKPMMIPFENLPDEEKKKDADQVRKAIEIYG
ncbi:hypothetical protein L0Y59_01750 [Candidatus Uhrbacteria bacterium]|nr:hypothetical protein [Candidatus Uhrbacteria bacterium]